MPTTKRRINVTLSPKLEKAITQIAEQESVPQATILVQLAEEALELNAAYFAHVERGRPLVTAKWAMTWRAYLKKGGKPKAG